jgi:hypothetical protein
MRTHSRVLFSLMSPACGSCRGIHGWGRVSNNTAVALGSSSSPRSLSYSINRKLHSAHSSTRPQPSYPGHIPLTPFENTFLAAGSALMSLIDTRRAGDSQSFLLHMCVTNNSVRHGCGLRRNYCWIHFGEAAGHCVRVSRGSTHSQRTTPDQFTDLRHGKVAISSREHFWTCIYRVA